MTTPKRLPPEASTPGGSERWPPQKVEKVDKLKGKKPVSLPAVAAVGAVKLATESDSSKLHSEMDAMNAEELLEHNQSKFQVYY